MYKIKTWIANKLVSLAFKIQPNNENVLSFMKTSILDMAIHGQYITRVNPVDIYFDTKGEIQCKIQKCINQTC
jgi:hypothetical protein